jgi:hypothetical protein
MNDMTISPRQPGPYRPSLAISSRDWLMIIAAFVLSRVALYGMGYFGVQLYGATDIGPLQACCQFDCVWFQRIIENGYDLYPRWLSKGNAANWAFMRSTRCSQAPLQPAQRRESDRPDAGGQHRLLHQPAADAAGAAPAQAGDDTARFGSGCWPSPLLRLFRLRLYRAHVHGADAGMFLFAYREQWLMVAFLGVFISATRNLG